jgi:hypothetical protein
VLLLRQWSRSVTPPSRQMHRHLALQANELHHKNHVFKQMNYLQSVQKI